MKIGNSMDDKPVNPVASYGQLLWGTALALMGLGVFFRVDTALGRLAEFPAFQSGATVFLARLSFYLMGVILLGGGIKKIIAQYNLLKKKDGSSDSLT